MVLASSTSEGAEPTLESPGIECRVAERHTCGIQSQCQPVAVHLTSELFWPARIRDISTRGVGLVLNRRFEVGAALTIELPASAPEMISQHFVRVVHTTALPNRTWLLGCAFVGELSAERLEAIVRLAGVQPVPVVQEHPPRLDRLILHAAAEASRSWMQRLRDRFGTEILANITFAGRGSDGTPACVEVRRLFMTGAWPLEPGTILDAWLDSKKSASPECQLRVVECRNQEGRWTVQYEFAERPSAEIVKAFGCGGSGLV